MEKGSHLLRATVAHMLPCRIEYCLSVWPKSGHSSQTPLSESVLHYVTPRLKGSLQGEHVHTHTHT